MATVREKPNGTFEFRITRKGLLPKPLYWTVYPDEYESALLRAKEIEAMLDKGIVPTELAERDDKRARQDLVGAVIRDYMLTQTITLDDQRQLNTLLDEPFTKLPLASLNGEWADSWVTKMKREWNLAPSTIRKYVGALARCLDWYIRKRPDDLKANPLRMLPKRYATYNDTDTALAVQNGGVAKDDIARDRRLEMAEETEVRRILAGGKPHKRERAFELQYQAALEFLFDLALESGMRLREMATLDVDQVQIDKRTIFLDKTKNGDKRQVPMSSVALTALARYQAHVQQSTRGMAGFSFDNGRLFPWWNGSASRADLEKMTSKLSGLFGRVFDAAGCGDIHFHDLRHEATSRLYERTNLSDLEISKITGHKDIRMLSRYANLRGSNLAERLW
ncbi:site-specific integrase [Chitinimonas sp.]|uniref:site-specific integrase n=1 Tax=Chitinimonas sp. TaxID=1934313 RepID=UPI0035ADE2C3